jgi:hypothetical protein
MFIYNIWLNNRFLEHIEASRLLQHLASTPALLVVSYHTYIIYHYLSLIYTITLLLTISLHLPWCSYYFIFILEMNNAWNFVPPIYRNHFASRAFITHRSIRFQLRFYKQFAQSYRTHELFRKIDIPVSFCLYRATTHPRHVLFCSVHQMHPPLVIVPYN